MPLAYQPLANTNGNQTSCQVRMDIQDLASFFMDKRVLRVMVPRFSWGARCVGELSWVYVMYIIL